MLLPAARGPLSGRIVAALRADDPGLLPTLRDEPAPDPLADEDLQLALWIAYELHYQGFADVAAHWEWEPGLLAVRNRCESDLLASLRREVARTDDPRPVPVRLRELVDDDDGPQLSRYLQQHAHRGQFREFVIHRSLYQLKEADPYTWAIPRLDGRPKAALVEVQADEYGAGDARRMHSELYRGLLREIGLDDGYGAYVDAVPAITLALSNVMSLFGLHRELRGALVGHLAAYEMTSSAPCRRYGKGLRRLGGTDEACAFFDAHITADALHEQILAHDVCGGLAEAEPDLAEDIVWGAAVCLHVDRRFAEHVFGCWDRQRSSLRPSDETAADLADVS